MRTMDEVDGIDQSNQTSLFLEEKQNIFVFCQILNKSIVVLALSSYIFVYLINR